MSTDQPSNSSRLGAQPNFTFEKRAGLLVVVAGLITTTLAMMGVYWANASDTNIMGWYANFIIPAGAILVGLAAGSGYGIASYWTGSKIGKGMLWLVLALQVVAYFVAVFVEYRVLVGQFGNMIPGNFVEYFDASTRAFAWDNNGQPGQPFGVWGYAMRLLEIAGFAGGGIIAPAIMMAVPYCDSCQVYKKSKEIGWFPASIKERKIKTNDAEAMKAYLEEKQSSADKAQVIVEEIEKSIREDGGHMAGEILQSYRAEKKQIQKLPVRGKVTLKYCPQCNKGLAILESVTGKGEAISTVTIKQIQTDPASTRRLLN